MDRKVNRYLEPVGGVEEKGWARCGLLLGRVGLFRFLLDGDEYLLHNIVARQPVTMNDDSIVCGAECTVRTFTIFCVSAVLRFKNLFHGNRTS